MYKEKISNLNINTEDYANIFCKSKKINIWIGLDYISKINRRSIKINFEKFTIKADLIKNKVYYSRNNLTKVLHFNKKDSYYEQIRNLLNNKLKNFCSYKDGRQVLEIIH